MTSFNLCRRSLLLLLAIFVGWIGSPKVADAHPDGVSVLKVNLDPSAVHASISIHTRDLSKWFPPLAYPNYVTDVSKALEQQAAEILTVRLNDTIVAPTSAKTSNPETGLLQLDLAYPAPATINYLALENKKLAKLPGGHEQWVFVEDRRHLRPGEKAGPTILQDRLTVELPSTDKVIDEATPNPTLSFDPRSPSSTTNPATTPATSPTTEPSQSPLTPARSSRAGDNGDRLSFFQMGVEHILTGTDHLLFVAALLLACRTFREAATIITFFTVAHSITLTLAATIDKMHLNASIVEPAVAATILFVAIENLIHRPNLGWRCAITFCFGLVHGLAFAGDLREKLPGSTFNDVAMPLLKFSAGVETGHLSLVAIALPLLLWFKSRYPTKDAIFSPAMSGVISAVGAFWLVTRIFFNDAG